MAASAAVFKLIPTPNPNQVSLGVEVRETLLAKNPGFFPQTGDKYAKFNATNFKGLKLDQSYAQGYGNYTYINCEKGSWGAPGADQIPTIILYFVKNLTNNQRLTPYRTLSSFGGEFVWDAILKALVFIPDRNFGRSTNGIRNGRGAVISGPQYYVRQVYQPAVRRGTRFITQYFFSDIPYNIPSYLVPIPRSVFYDVPGAQGYFPDCIGPEISIPDTQTANAAFVAGAQSYASGALSGQFFPETNFEDWTPYFTKDDQEFQNGYLRTRTYAIPPLVDDQPNIR